ncbi:MAG: VCBS repeat-containing protein [Candidatus Eisenbacteria sp.]|nr:VCBS repeat-containing protein [Candidatus Eisenbacteria bacterium]
MDSDRSSIDAEHRSLGPETDSTAAVASVLFDFEDGSLEGWHPRPGDEPFIEFSIAEENPLSGSRSLRCRIRGWHTVDNEQVVLQRPFTHPVLVDSATVVSWAWWFEDRINSDGIGLRLINDPHPHGTMYDWPWASHSLYERGEWPYEDAAGQTHWHQEILGRDYAGRDCARTLEPQFPWRITGIELFFWSPKDQIAYFDDIRIDLAGAPLRDRPETLKSSSITPRAVSLLVGDLDNDGYLDRMIGCLNDPPILQMGAGGPTWRYVDARERGLETAHSLSLPRVADLNRDGRLDLLGIQENELVIYHGLGHGYFRRVPAPHAPDLHWNPPATILVADLARAHERPQILVNRINAMAHDTLYVWTDDGQYVGQPSPKPPAGSPRLGFRTLSLAVDIDADFDQDLFCTNTDLFLQDQSELACATESWLPEVGSFQTGAAFGDIDNDADLDLFIAVDHRHYEDDPYVTQRHSQLYRHDGDRFTNISEQLDIPPSGHAHSPIFADFDLDGDLDLLFTQRSPTPQPLPAYVWLENDGHGRFTTHVNPDTSWLNRAPPASQVACFDADDDGDPDLLLMRIKDGWIDLITNPLNTDRWIKARVVDRHGLPHAGGAHVYLREPASDSAPAGDAKLIGYRQTGLGSLGAGWGELIFGCPTAGPFEITAVFPSCPDNPVVLRGIEPGSRVRLVEPAFAGIWGQRWAQMIVDLRHWIDRLAATGRAALLSAGLACGILFGATLFGVRRWIVPRRWQKKLMPDRIRWGPSWNAIIGGAAGGWIPPSIRLFLFGVGVLLLMALSGSFWLWPTHPAGESARELGLAGILAGVLGGAGLSLLDSRRRSAAVAPVEDRDHLQLQLLDALDGFTHASWLTYLGGIASLCRSLAEGADPKLVLPRLGKRIESYDTVIAPQMLRIVQLLPCGGIAPHLAIRFGSSLEQIETSIEAIRPWIDKTTNGDIHTGLPDERALHLLARCEAETRTAVEELFQTLGRRFSSDVSAELQAVLHRLREETPGVELSTDIPEALPPVFAVRGELANIFENLLRNALRGAKQNSAQRDPRVHVAVRLQGGLVVASITDSGPGMPAEVRNSLSAVQRSELQGHGRGIPYACRRLRLFDGKVDVVRSSPQDGTLVTVTLRVLRKATHDGATTLLPPDGPMVDDSEMTPSTARTNPQTGRTP